MSGYYGWDNNDARVVCRQLGYSVNTGEGEVVGKKSDVAMGPQLLNCQTQSHLSWLVVIPLQQKKSLVRQFGAGGDFQFSTLSGHFYTVITIL